MTTITGNAGIESDDFAEGSLDATWTKTRETGGASVEFEGSGTRDARCNMVIPASNFSLSTVGSLRCLQTASDNDFQLEVKIDTIPPGSCNSGFWIQDAGPGSGPTADLVWFIAESSAVDGDLEFHSLTIEDLAIRSNEFTDYGSSPDPPFWLRLDRTGDDWTFEYSFTGNNWVETDTQTFAMTVAAVGFCQSNIDPAFPASTGKFDYFFENSARIAREDGAQRVLVIS